MRRILYVWNYREWGGAQIYFLSLMKAAREVANPFEVKAIIPEDSDERVLKYLADLNVPVEFVQAAPPAVGTAKGFVGKLLHRIRVYRSENRLVTRILKELAEGRDDQPQASGVPVVHIDLGFWQSYRALARLLRRANVFVTQHTALVDPGGIRGLSWRMKGKRVSGFPNFVVLASNNDAKNSLRPFLTQKKFDSIRVTYTGIDPDEIADVDDAGSHAEHRRSGHSLSAGMPLVITVGQFIERKGCWVVLDALRKLRDAGENIQFLWLGTSALDSGTVEIINGYHLGDRFRFLSGEEIGPSRNDLLGLLGTADTFVLASFREGLPIALVEAMALGVPCIASRVGAIPEAIDHNVSGLVVTPGDADDLAEAIRTLVHDPEMRKMFGTAARAIAFEKFNQKTTAEETVRIYDKVWKTSG